MNGILSCPETNRLDPKLQDVFPVFPNPFACASLLTGFTPWSARLRLVLPSRLGPMPNLSLARCCFILVARSVIAERACCRFQLSNAPCETMVATLQSFSIMSFLLCSPVRDQIPQFLVRRNRSGSSLSRGRGICSLAWEIAAYGDCTDLEALLRSKRAR